MLSSEGIQDMLPAQLEFGWIGGRTMVLEVDEDGCVGDPDATVETPVAYVVSREWFARIDAMSKTLKEDDTRERVVEMLEELGRGGCVDAVELGALYDQVFFALADVVRGS